MYMWTSYGPYLHGGPVEVREGRVVKAPSDGLGRPLDIKDVWLTDQVQQHTALEHQDNALSSRFKI